MKADLTIISSRKCQGASAIRILVISKTSMEDSAISGNKGVEGLKSSYLYD
jgi:hypothetical protein